MQSRTLVFLILTALIITCISCLNFKKSALTIERANEIANKFSPIYYLDNNEMYFPSAIEWFDINWKNATIGDEDARVNYNYKGPEKLLENAPVYISVLENEDETLRISYAVLYAFDGCGPQFKLVGQVWGSGINKNLPLCPGLTHWGDIERVTLVLDKSYDKILTLEYRNHEFSKILSPNEVKFEGTRPVVFVALGSHASYSTAGEVSFLELWKKSGMSYNTFGGFVDITSNENSKNKWTNYIPRLLKLNGEPGKNLSQAEIYLSFLYFGKLGADLNNTKLDEIVTEVLRVAKIINTFSSTISKQIIQSLEKMNSYLKGSASSSLASSLNKDWW